MKLVITFLFLFACISWQACNNKSSENNLWGRWRLDSSARPNEKMGRRSGLVIIFYKNGEFAYGWHSGDIGHSSKGKFTIKIDTLTKLKSLDMITDTLYYGIKIPREHFKLTILEIGINRLKTINEEGYEFGHLFDRINVFKKE
jgi:hypothetical protein